MDEQLSAGLHSETITNSRKTWLVRAKENVIVAPRCRQIIVGKLESEKEESLPPLVCVEPAQLPVEGILPACSLSRFMSGAPEPSRTEAQASHGQTWPPKNCAYVLIANFSNETLTLSKATVLAVAEDVSESLVDCINTTQINPRSRKGRKETRSCTKTFCETN